MDPVGQLVLCHRTVRRTVVLHQPVAVGGPEIREVGTRVAMPSLARAPDAGHEYFKGLAEETGIPYQTLINLYLRDCAESKRDLNLDWCPEKSMAG